MIRGGASDGQDGDLDPHQGASQSETLRRVRSSRLIWSDTPNQATCFAFRVGPAREESPENRMRGGNGGADGTRTRDPLIDSQVPQVAQTSQVA